MSTETRSSTVLGIPDESINFRILWCSKMTRNWTAIVNWNMLSLAVERNYLLKYDKFTCIGLLEFLPPKNSMKDHKSYDLMKKIV